MVNGYSATTPVEYMQLEEALATFPDRPSIEVLHDTGVTHCLFDVQASQGHAAALAEPQRLAALGFEIECDDPHQGVQIWRLPQRP